jgi:hypothetical protein
MPVLESVRHAQRRALPGLIQVGCIAGSTHRSEYVENPFSRFSCNTFFRSAVRFSPLSDLATVFPFYHLTRTFKVFVTQFNTLFYMGMDFDLSIKRRT